MKSSIFSIQTKVHSFLKQCLHNLHFMKTGSFQETIFVVVFFECCCEMYVFWGTFKIWKRLGDFIKKFAEQFVLHFDQAKRKK